jgi:hypothetical protein
MQKNRSHVTSAFIVTALSVLAATMPLLRSAHAQDPLPQFRQEWRNRDYADLRNPLIDYWYSLNGQDNFEVDFMIGTTLWNLSDSRDQGCQYLQSMAGVYGDVNQAHDVAGERVNLATALCNDCKVSCPHAETMFVLKKPRRRADILGSVRPQHRASQGLQTSDAVDIRSVVGRTAPLQNAIIAGHTFDFGVEARYVLASVDNAVVQIGVEEYPKSAGGCQGVLHNTNGGNDFKIKRGSGALSTVVTWRGDHPAYPGGGYLSLGAIFADPQSGNVFRQFGIFAQYCYAFVPAGGHRID